VTRRRHTHFDPGAATAPDLFHGQTYEPEHDHARLAGQLERVATLMRDGVWRTLAEIVAAVGGSEAGVSARLRDLRKKDFGAHVVERRRRGEPKLGLWEYRVLGRLVQTSIV
jgi:hypothetical protein